MATPTKENTTAHAPAASGDPTDSWIKVQDHRPMYLPEECGRTAVQGYLLGTMEMNPSNKNKKEDVPIEEQYWVALVMQLTQPAKARSPEGDVREYPPGTQIIVGGADMASLYNRADDRVKAYEAKVWPVKQLALGGGRKMWLFEKRVNPQTVNRATNHLEFLEGRAAELDADPFNGAKQLPSGNGPGAGTPALPAAATAAARS
jgi:hypothetical protein